MKDAEDCFPNLKFSKPLKKKCLTWDMNTLLSATDNNTIEFATEIPKNSPFISIGREIRIIRPDSLRNFSVPELWDIIEQLIIFFDFSDRDWQQTYFCMQ